MRIRTLEDVNIAVFNGTGNKELDRRIQLYYQSRSEVSKKIIKRYWWNYESIVKQAFNLKLSTYKALSTRMINDVREIVNDYKSYRRKLIKEANKQHNNITDMTSYREDKAERIRVNKFKLGIYD
nr:MAG TPA: hypothetical protein [Caudoviricetes sp.]